MTAWVVTHEAVLRGIAFVSVFLAMAIAEVFVEERPRRIDRTNPARGESHQEAA